MTGRTAVLLVALGLGCGANGRPDGDEDVAGGDTVDDDGPDAGDRGEGDARDDEAGDTPDGAVDDAGPDVVWWTPTQQCGAYEPDPPAWVAPPCGPGCRQVGFAAAIAEGSFAALSDRYIFYRGRQHTWMIDRSTGEESVLFCHPYFVGSYGVQIDGDTAVYAITGRPAEEDEGTSYAAVWVANLATGRQWPVAEWASPVTEGSTELSGLALSGRRAAFTMTDVQVIDATESITRRRMDIYVVDIDTRDLTRVSDLGWPAGLGWPDISGDWVVYTTVGSVYAHNLASGITIGPDIPGDQWYPRIDGSRVVWMDHRNSPGGYGRGGTWELYSYDLDAETEFLIPTGEPVNEYAQPDIRGDLLVWSDYRFSTPETTNSDLFLYRFSTGREQRVTSLDGEAVAPKLGSNEVLFLWFPDPRGTYPVNRALCLQELPAP